MDTYSILFGVFSKLVDDMLDNPVFRTAFGKNGDTAIEFFKAAMYSFSAGLIIHNPIFGLFFVLVSTAAIIQDIYFNKIIDPKDKALNDKTWHAYIAITGFLTALSFLFNPPTDVHYPFFFITTILICIGCIILEPFLIPENNSTRKMKFRLYGSFFVYFLIYNRHLIQSYMPMNMDYYFHFLHFIIGYFITSLIINYFYPYNSLLGHSKLA